MATGPAGRGSSQKWPRTSLQARAVALGGETGDDLRERNLERDGTNLLTSYLTTTAESKPGPLGRPARAPVLLVVVWSMCAAIRIAYGRAAVAACLGTGGAFYGLHRPRPARACQWWRGAKDVRQTTPVGPVAAHRAGSPGQPRRPGGSEPLSRRSQGSIHSAVVAAILGDRIARAPESVTLPRSTIRR